MMLAPHVWLPSRQRWVLATTVHTECLERSYEQPAKAVIQKVPERFQGFEACKFSDPEALEVAERFNLTTGYRAIAIIGNPGKGKSRLMWHVVEGFFEDLKKLGSQRWVDYWVFPDLVTDFDKYLLKKVKESTYAFIDDVGSTQAFGRERAQLQDVIRARIQNKRWTFLTIDNPEFDPNFKDLFRERAVEIYVE
jgi:DNA replication protein DnaC